MNKTGVHPKPKKESIRFLDLPTSNLTNNQMFELDEFFKKPSFPTDILIDLPPFHNLQASQTND